MQIRCSTSSNGRENEYDMLVGINLLREGLDIPEVSLVAILDADKEGYLRSQTSLIQTCGRAARNLEGRVIMYADRTTGSMTRAIGEMDRRRKKQTAHNKKHKITPRSISRPIPDLLKKLQRSAGKEVPRAAEDADVYITAADLEKTIRTLRKKMTDAANKMDFEAAADYRDRMHALERRKIEAGL